MNAQETMVLRNGDVHLKNFGLLYTHPRTDDIRLSPLYDIVNTTVYIPKDVPALKMAKTKQWPTRAQLIDFGYNHCQVDKPAEVIDRTIEAATSYQSEIETGEIWEKIRREIERGCDSLRACRVVGTGVDRVVPPNIFSPE